MVRLTEDLGAFADQIWEGFAATDAAQERVPPVCREAIRYCGRSISAVHRREMDSTGVLLSSARRLLDEAAEAVTAERELSQVGCHCDAQDEYVKGKVVLALITGRPVPGPNRLRVDPVPYFHGLPDTVGELRHYLLDSMSKGDMSRGTDFLTVMDDIYNIPGHHELPGRRYRRPSPRHGHGARGTGDDT
jgi:translin